MCRFIEENVWNGEWEMVNEPRKIIVVADGPTCTGFRLAGVQDTYPREGKEAEAKIVELMEAEDAGVIITNEKIMDSLDWRLKKKIDRAARPVVIAVPDKNGPVEQKDSLASQVKRALGFELMK